MKKFNLSGDYTAELERYVSEIVDETRRQVVMRREFVKHELETHETVTDEIKQVVEQEADEKFINTYANRALRMWAVEALTDAYIEVSGDIPDAYQLERLTDAILNEELSDLDTYKIQRNEYPFMSERQFERRHDREASEKVAEEYGTDGQNHRKPIRRKRSTSENIFTDKNAKARNRERHRKYKEFTQVQPVMRWNMYTGEIHE